MLRSTRTIYLFYFFKDIPQTDIKFVTSNCPDENLETTPGVILKFPCEQFNVTNLM